MLFQKAFGKNVQIGIIAVANVDYPANQWWHYSEGLKDVVSEFAACLVCPVSVLPLISGATSSARSSRFDRPVSPEPENSDPIAGSPGFGLPFNNFVE